MMAAGMFGSRAAIERSVLAEPTKDSVSSSRNGGRNHTVAQAKRAARKARNCAAYRRACR